MKPLPILCIVVVLDQWKIALSNDKRPARPLFVLSSLRCRDHDFQADL
jgi:hypothetical protein